ncbi:MAG TPA: glycosyltransferase family 4 protein [Myxococcota bacterium]|nr:glycosyltransferase family 4 protein [Myxococcota bacterium]
MKQPAGRHRVLVIAEAANPEWVSVPLVGWQLAAALREVADVHVVTQVRNRAAIERAGWREGKDFTALDTEQLARGLYRLSERMRGGEGKGWTTLAALNTPAYYYFEHRVWKQFGSALAAREFDLVHRVTPLSPTTPSSIAARCRRAGVPFVIGPLNGGTPWPPGFEYARRREREWLSYVRAVYKLLPGYRGTRANASAIVVASRATWDDMPVSCAGKLLYVPENGIDPARFTARRTHRAARPIRLAFVGRLVPYKGADMLLEAAAPLLRAGAATLEILGDGPERAALERQIAELGIASSARLAGWIEHRELQHHLAQADVFAFPSIREFGGGVVLEAMAVGLVPVVVDYGGPGELVTRDSGVAVPIGSRSQVIERMRDALTELAARPERIDALSARAIERVEREFTWARKAEQMAAVYDWVLGKCGKPELALPAGH